MFDLKSTNWKGISHQKEKDAESRPWHNAWAIAITHTNQEKRGLRGR